MLEEKKEKTLQRPLLNNKIVIVFKTMKLTDNFI